MIAPESLAGFLLTSVLLCLAPGPDNLFVLTQSAMYGFRSGLLVTLGLCTGLIVHTSAVALGIAVIFQESTQAFFLLKTIGAMYLVYLAWQALRAPVVSIDERRGSTLSRAALYRRGIFMNVTNPKVSVFFLAFLPQFADPAQGDLVLQFFVLGAIFIAATLGVFGSIAFAAGALGSWLGRSPRAQKFLNQASALVLIGLAARLLTTRA
ncbi:MAG: LysE family translocator [Pseudomonadales bacterium]|nr:LysE family translocator [Pseudomonadales bacterium]MCP5330156.1 LysE family translocator [Pseudomonadales bacterium]MCP5344462.1 LysE family translocator [Pseudomonadales bacterium]